MFNNKVYHKIDALSGSIATLRAEGVKYNEIAEVESRAGTSLAQVIKLDGPNVTLQIFAGARGVDTAAKVRVLGETMKVPFSAAPSRAPASRATAVPRSTRTPRRSASPRSTRRSASCPTAWSARTSR